MLWSYFKSQGETEKFIVGWCEESNSSSVFIGVQSCLASYGVSWASSRSIFQSQKYMEGCGGEDCNKIIGLEDNLSF